MMNLDQLSLKLSIRWRVQEDQHYVDVSLQSVSWVDLDVGGDLAEFRNLTGACV
eukprot:m.478567 g.478567  ORF g.478567 m.478567 type:complete len:54 (-) comp47086_c0_seq1:1654-1815(-)